MADLKERLLAHLQGADAAHDTAHALRVWSLAQRIAKGEGVVAGRELMAAALLHDLVTLPKDHSDRARASSLSASAARPILASEGFSPHEIEEVAHAIEAHSYSAGIAPRTSLARVLQDADRIEALGAIGLARVFAVSGALGRSLWHPEDPFAHHRAPDDSHWALDHFQTKLLRLPATMTTGTGQKIAKQRASVLERFLTDLTAELHLD